jgi:hypothetical protein
MKSKNRKTKENKEKKTTTHLSPSLSLSLPYLVILEFVIYYLNIHWNLRLCK